MSTQPESQWKVVGNTATNTRRNAGQRTTSSNTAPSTSSNEAASTTTTDTSSNVNEAQRKETVANQTEPKTADLDTNESSTTSPSNAARKARAPVRRNQMPSKRVQRKTSVVSSDNTNQTSTSNPTETNTATNTNTSNVSTDANKNNNQTNDTDTTSKTTTSTSTKNVWEKRREQKDRSTQNKKPETQITTSSQLQSQSQSQSQPQIQTASNKYSAIKRTPAAVEASKKPLNVEQPKRPPHVTEPSKPLTEPAKPTVTKNQPSTKTNENESIRPAEIPQSTQIAQPAQPSPSRFASQSGYRPPHQRGADAPVVKPPDENELMGRKDNNRNQSNYSFRDKETIRSTGAEREVRRTDSSGKGFERKPLSENEKSNGGRRFENEDQNDEFGKDKERKKSFKEREFSRDFPRNKEKRPETNFGNTAIRKTDIPSERNVNTIAARTKSVTTATKKDSLTNSTNVVRSQSLQNEQGTGSLLRNQKPPGMKSVQKTFSAPKEQLVKVVKLHGSIEPKDEKIMKIKQQLKDKTKININAPGGGFQPVLSSAQEALRAISDGNMDITRENAEMVQRELGTNLNPLGPEFAPQEVITDVDGDTSLEQSQFPADQGQYSSEQIGPVYDNGNVARHGDTMEEMNTLQWSFPPSESGVYAQDFGVEGEYELHNYPDFERNQEMGMDPTMGGSNNATMGGATIPPNGNLGGPPSQSPEHTSHPINEAYNTQSTVTMAQPSLPITGQGALPNMLANTYNPAHTTEDLASQQASEAQQVKMKAQQAIQQNPQMFTANEYTGNAPTMVSVNPAVAWRYNPQFAGPIGDHTQVWPSAEDPQQMYAMWQQRMNATGHTPQPPPQNQPVYVSHYNPMASQNESGYAPRREWNRRSRGGNQNRQYRGRGRRRFDHRFDNNDNNDSNAQKNEAEVNMGGNNPQIMGRGGKYNDRRENFKKRYGQPKRNYANYRTKDQGFMSQTGDSNDNVNSNEIKNQELNPNMRNNMDDRSQTNQWGNLQTDYGAFGYNGNTEDIMRKFDTENTMSDDKKIHIQRKDENNSNFPTDFETLTLSDWYFIIEGLTPQRVETFQKQLFEMTNPVSLKTFRLELPSSPIQPAWVDRIKWTQLSEYLSQAKLESVEITSHLQTKLDVYNEKDFQELEPVAKFVTSLKCKRLVIEHAPCKVTPEYIQSLSNEIEELKLLCPSIEWNIPLVRSLSSNLNYLALICPNTTMTIQDFLDALEGKVDRLYLCNDEASSRKLSPEDIAKLFEHVLKLELDGSLLTEIRPMSETATTKTESLIIHLKDKVLEKDFYSKYSFPKSIHSFNLCPVDPSRMFKGWNETSASTSPSSKDFVRQGISNDEIKTDVQHNKPLVATTHMRTEEQSQGLDNTTTVEENKVIPTDTTSEQSQNTTKKMSFKEKLQSGPKAVKKTSTLRIGNTQ